MDVKIFMAVSAILLVVGVLIAVSADELKWIVGGIIFAFINLVTLFRFVLQERKRKARSHHRTDPL